jgi:hypothetical protein
VNEEWKDERTDEQRRADDALTQAINDVCRAYSDPPGEFDTYVSGNYVVIASARRFYEGDPRKGQETIVPVIYKNQDVALHEVLGLLNYALARVQRLVVVDIRED